ncbi:MAG: hypothetical protein AB7N54_05570 [Alphaproteobacteria bacterium]
MKLPTRIAACVMSFLILVAVLPTAGAMTFSPQQFTCPYDGTVFTVEVQRSGTSFGAMLDFRPFGAITSPWPLATCPTNGFVFYKPEFSEDDLEKLRPVILSDEYQSIRGETAYYRAAWILSRTGAERAQIADYLLAATWEVEGKADYRRYVDELLPHLEALAAGTDEREMRWQLGVLATELFRRTGRFEQATRHVDDVLADAHEGSFHYLLGRYQQELIARRDVRPHPVPKEIAAKARR